MASYTPTLAVSPEERILTPDFPEKVLIGERADAHIAAKTLSLDRLISAFEDSIRDGKLSGGWKVALLAAKASDGSEQTFAKMSAAILRALENQGPRGIISGRGKWIKAAKENILIEANKFLARHGGGILSEAKGLSAKDSVLDGRARIVSDPDSAGLDLGKIRDRLPVADSREICVFAMFLANNLDTIYVEGSRERAKKRFMSIFTPIVSLEQLVGGVAALEEMKGIGAFAGLLREASAAWGEACLKYLKQNENPWDFRKKLYGSFVTGIVHHKLLDFLADEFCKGHEAEYAQGFIAEKDNECAIILYASAPRALKEKIEKIFLGYGDMLDDEAKICKLGIVLREMEDAEKKLAEYVFRSAPSDRTPKRFADAVLSAKNVLERSGRGEESVEMFDRIVEETKAARAAAAEAHKQERVARIAAKTRDAAQGAVAYNDEKPKKREGAMSAEEFAAKLGLAVKKDGLPKDLEMRAVALGTPIAALESETIEIMIDVAARAEVFKDQDSVEALCHAESALRKFGVTKVVFRKTASIDVEFVFEKLGREEKAPEPFITCVHIADDGEIKMNNFPPALTWLADIFKAEALRMLCECVYGGAPEGCDTHTINVILGLAEYVEELAAQGAPQKTSSVSGQPEASSSQAEKSPEELTRDFMLKNYRAFYDFISSLRNGTGSKLKMPDFKSIAANLFQMQATMVVNKAIPPDRARVELQPDCHILAQFVDSIEILNPAQSRLEMRKLNISPKLLHISSDALTQEGELDAYLALVNLKIGDKTETVHVCILPPRFDVYVIGVDTATIIDGEDNNAAAFLHLVLEAFRRAVTRTDDPSRTSPKKKSGDGSQTQFSAITQKVIEDATNGSFPTIVVLWEKEKGVGESADFAKGGKSDSMRREKMIEEVFEKIATDQDDLKEMFIARGTFLKARDFVRIMPTAISKEVLPREAWMIEDGQSVLKKDFSDIYLPIDSAEKMEVVLEALRSKRAVVKAESSFNPSDKADAGNVFKNGIVERKIVLDTDFKERCAEYLNKKGNWPNAYNEFFMDAIELCRRADPSITPVDVFSAFKSMSVLSPQSVHLAMSGSRDYRLAYLPRDGGPEMPRGDELTVFGNNNDPLSIIEGNRARLSQVTSAWIRGSSRSPEQTFAANAQRQYKSQFVGTQVSLEPRARALKVFEFTDGTHAFVYLDASRDVVDHITLNSVSAIARLLSFPSVQLAVQNVEEDNNSGRHSDFTNMKDWTTQELRRLEDEGVLSLKREGKRITGIARAKPVKRKKVVVMTEEQAGYRQFSVEPTSLGAYQKFAHEQGAERKFDLPYDPKTALIQSVFYEMLGY